jgi:hypothetical protein
MKLLLRIFSLIKHKAPRSQYFLEIGAYFLRKGVGYKIGDPVKYRVGQKGGRMKQYYVANLFYDFGNNRVNHTITKNRPKK